jgi:hypothetical protein
MSSLKSTAVQPQIYEKNTHPFVSHLQMTPQDLTTILEMPKMLVSLAEAAEVPLKVASELQTFVTVGHYAIGHQFVQWTSEVP